MRGLYHKPVVMDILAWLRVLNDRYDNVSWHRILSSPHTGLSNKTIQDINLESRLRAHGTYEVLTSLPEIPAEEAESIRKTLKTYEELLALSRSKRASELLILATRLTGLIEIINTLSEVERYEAFRQLQQVYERVRRFEDGASDKHLQSFLNEFQHEIDAGETGAISLDIESSGPDTVKILTIHASKGLEFPHVFVVNMVAQRFPSRSKPLAVPIHEELLTTSGEGGGHLEEERRLFYVAMTRAKQCLYFTSADDYGGVRKKKLSPFLLELGYEKPELEQEDGASWLENASTQKSTKTATRVVDIPKHFSFTQLEAFRTCPLQYEFAHVLKIPVLGKYQMSYGKSVHNTLEHFFKARKETGAFMSEEELLALYEEEWIDEWYANRAMHDKYKQQGIDSLVTHRNELMANTPDIFAIEEGFTLKLGEVIIKGRIDRIDQVGGGLRILDYKTGTPKI